MPKQITSKINVKLLIVLFLFLIGAIISLTYFKTKKQSQQFNTDSNTASILSSLNQRYNNSIPWSILKNKSTYMFFPNEIKGLTLTLGKVYENHQNYNAISNLESKDKLVNIPIKNSYSGVYTIPEDLKKNFNLDDLKNRLIVSPLLTVIIHEPNRKLSNNEVLTFMNNFECNNNETSVKVTYFQDKQFTLRHCDTNMSESQKNKIKNAVKNGEIAPYDETYQIYFVDRNLLTIIGINTSILNNSKEYIADYFNKILISNDSLFIKENQIETIEAQRKSEEKLNRLLPGRNQ